MDVKYEAKAEQNERVGVAHGQRSTNMREKGQAQARSRGLHQVDLVENPFEVVSVTFLLDKLGNKLYVRSLVESMHRLSTF